VKERGRAGVARHSASIEEGDVTRYAVDEDNAMLVRTWSTGRGDWAAAVTALSAHVDVERHQSLAAELTGLSQQLWRCYTHPPKTDPDTDVNTQDWRRQQTRDTFSTVIASVMSPNLEDDDGCLSVVIDPVEESAHRVGRALHEIGDDAVRDAVRADIEAELQAVESAEQGELAGRAGQAAVLSRSDASPGLIAKADAILRKNPLDAWMALRDCEPAAAAVAAAHWLKIAVDVIAKAARMPARRVLSAADDEDGTEHPAAAKILSLLHSSDATYDIVTWEVEQALQVAEGYLLVPAAEDADEEENIELTPLDPQRPALSLMEDLLDSLRSCREMYARYAEKAAVGEGDFLDDAAMDALFCNAVRAKADTRPIDIP
jgi:hypothetical protein